MTGSGSDRPDVFVSYCRDDRASVAAIVRALEAEGRTVWWDARLEAGDAFDAEIAAALRAVKCVLVCWSNRSINSEWVRAEALEGRRRGVLISCVLEPCEPIPPFNILHHEDLSQWRHDRNDAVWRRLSDAISDRRSNRPPLLQAVCHESARKARFVRPAWLVAIAVLALAALAIQPRAPGQRTTETDVGESSLAFTEEGIALAAGGASDAFDGALYSSDQAATEDAASLSEVDETDPSMTHAEPGAGDTSDNAPEADQLPSAEASLPVVDVSGLDDGSDETVEALPTELDGIDGDSLRPVSGATNALLN